MSLWKDRLTQHPVHAEITSLEGVLQQAAGLAKSNPEMLDRIIRLQNVRLLASTTLKSVDPQLVPLGVLNNLHSSMQALRNEVTNYNSNQNQGHINNADQHADNVIVYLTQLPRTVTRRDIERIGEAVGNFENQALEALKAIGNEAASLRGQVDALAQKAAETVSDVASQKGVLAAAVTQIQNQFLQEQESRARQFTQAEQVRTEEATKADQARKEHFEKIAEEQRITYEQQAENSRRAHSTLVDELKTGGEKLLSEIQDLKGQAERLLGIVGTTTIISGYKREADSAKRRAFWWNIVTVASIIGFTGGTVLALLPVVRGEVQLTWENLLARVVLSLALGVLGTYAARQAKDGEEVERRNRRYELELSSIGPFIAELQPDTQRELKQQLVNRLFGQPDPGKALAKEAMNTNLTEVLKVVLENIPRLRS